jgi:hypothetical protein
MRSFAPPGAFRISKVEHQRSCGALSILSALILVFTLITIAAKLRGLDITCGCFGHASQNWSFPAHLATNLVILAALLVLWLSNRLAKPL